MTRNLGFSLLEISIALLIISILAAGVIIGNDLIRAAELRSLQKEISKFQTAVNIFRSKYSALPGDMKNATKFWGRADNGTFTGQCVSPASDQGIGTQTCNGNGDGILGIIGRADVSRYEAFRSWQHLSNAQLIPGNYTGVHGDGGTTHHIIGENCPASKLSGGGWTLSYRENLPPDMVYTFDASNEKTSLVVGTQKSGNSSTTGHIVTSEEALSIDNKVDDGKPGLGKVNSFLRTVAPDCITSNTPETAKYNTNNKDISCALLFVID